MISDIGGSAVAVLILVTLIAGVTDGLAGFGFGFAFVGTTTLVTVIDPMTAIVFMIIPIFSVNLSLVRDLPRDELRTCSRRLAPLMIAALVGTIVGMVALGSVPTAPLRVGLGVLTLGFVANAQRRLPLLKWSTDGIGTFGHTRVGTLVRSW